MDQQELPPVVVTLAIRDFDRLTFSPKNVPPIIGVFWQNSIFEGGVFCHEENEVYGGTDRLRA